MTPAKALQELREYFEQKRNLALRQQTAVESVEAASFGLQAACFDHATAMVDQYVLEVSEP